jgi:hypothetical protein
VAVGAVTVPSLVASVALSGRGGDAGRYAFYGAPTRAWEFGLGAACALAAPSVVRVPQRVLALAAVVGLGCIDHAATATNGSAGFPGSAALWPVAGACLLLLAASGPVSRALSTRPLVAIGDVSYGWYLWHWPFIVFATALLPASGLLSPGAAVLALVPAALSYRFVEQPIRARVRAGTWTAPRLASVCVAVAVASAGLLLVTKAVLLDTDRSFSALNGTQALHADVLRGCDELNWFFQGGHRCTWAVPHARGTAVLVGDSNAGQFTEPFTQAATSLHLTAHVSTYSGCVFAELPVQPKAGSCEAYVEATVRRLVRQRPDMVVLATRADQYIADGLDARTFELGLRRALQPLSRTGVRVLLVEPIPLVPFDPARCSVVSLVANGCGASVRRAAVEVERGAALAAEGRATAGLRGVTEVDFVPALCGQAACASRLRGVDMYRDAHHLSVSGALTLTGTFARLLRPA